MRSRAPLLLLLLLLAPAAAAQEPAEGFALAAGTYRPFGRTLSEGDRLIVNLTSDVPVDLLVVAGPDDAFYTGNGSAGPAAAHLDAREANITFDVPSGGQWTVVVDNTDRPDGGANGSANATVGLRIVVQRIIVPEPPVPDLGTGGDQDPGTRNPWPVLMFTAPHWDLDAIGLGGVALWMLVFAAWAAIGYREGWAKVLVLTVGVGALVAAWLFLPRLGPITGVGLPLLFGAGVAWLAVKGTQDMRQAVRLALLGSVLGVLCGEIVAHLLSLAWSDPGLLVLGADRFSDAFFLVPVAAVLLTLLLTIVPAFVDAFDDEDEAAPAPAQPGLGATFDVTCLRCGTSIKVDRSMRRFRVATDRYEFACPNCQAWMEWAEPKAQA